MSVVTPARCDKCGAALGARQQPLSRVQAGVLKVICDSIARGSYAPTHTEIAKVFGWKSISTVHEHLTALERKGYIRRAHNRERGITVLVSYDDVGTIPVERTDG